MQSNSRSYYDRNFTWFRNKDGTTSSSFLDVPTEYRTFTVTNGLRQGDKRSPQPISFGKTITDGQLREVRITRSGVPNDRLSYQKYHDAIGPWSMSLHGGLFDGRLNWQILEEYCWKRIYEQMRYGSGNLVVDLAESRETLRMIRNATSVRKLAQQFVKEVVKPKNLSGSRRLKYATDKWLEYRYGWLPFVSSTYELLKTLSNKVNAKAVVPIESRNSWEDQFFVRNAATNHVVPPQINELNIHQSGRVLVKVRMRPRTTLEIYDFTSLNPLGIAWELAPLSFVADWFTNIGDCLSLWEDYILFANRFVDGFETMTWKEDVKFTYGASYYKPPPLYPNGDPWDDVLVSCTDVRQARRTWKWKNRFTLSAPPRPGGPRIEVKLGANRLLDAASLIRGVFGKV